MKRFFGIVILFALMMFPGCDDGDPAIIKVLPVPYHSQVLHTYCAATCIQMWAEYDGLIWSQEQIANYIGTGPTGSAPLDVVDGVKTFTYSWAFFAHIDDDEPGAQGDLLAACINGIDESFPAIVPFYEGSHSVLATGFEWHYENGKPIAEAMYFNDPNPAIGGPTSENAAYVKDALFTPYAGIYYVILGDECFLHRGVVGHDTFVIRGGTYYGGPIVYDPKGLLDINSNPVD